MSKIKYPIYACTLFIAPIFFSYLAYRGSGFAKEIDTNGYIELAGAFDFLSVIFSIFSISKRGSHSWLYFTLFSAMVYIIYILEGSHADFYMKSFYAFSVPAGFIAIDLAESRNLHLICKWIEPISLFVSGALIYSLPSVLFYRSATFEYQSYAYFCAFGYLITLFLILFGETYDRFKVFKYKIYMIFQIVLLVILAIAALISGGRGGFLLIIIGSIALIIKSGNNLFKIKGFALLLGIVVIVFVVPYLPSYIFDFASIGSERTFSFITGDKLDMTATSGRDDIYKVSWNYFLDSPVIGHGLFKYVDEVSYHGYPHNFVLEILIQGGLLFFTLISIFISKIYNKYKFLRAYDEDNSLFVTLALWPCVELLFSGSYIMIGLFWFVMLYIISYRIYPIK